MAFTANWRLLMKRKKCRRNWQFRWNQNGTKWHRPNRRHIITNDTSKSWLERNKWSDQFLPLQVEQRHPERRCQCDPKKIITYLRFIRKNIPPTVYKPINNGRIMDFAADATNSTEIRSGLQQLVDVCIWVVDLMVYCNFGIFGPKESTGITKCVQK